MFLLWLLLVVTCWEGGVTGKVTGTATCEWSGLGEPARVTCHYSQNVVEADDVSVVLLRLEGRQEKVVECHRFPEKEFDCLYVDGYRINGTISNQMIISIPIARPEQQGTYSCEAVINQSTEQMASCILKYEESNNATTSAPPFQQKTDDHRNKDAGTSDVKDWMAATIVLSVLLVTAVVFALFASVRWRREYKLRQEIEARELGRACEAFFQCLGAWCRDRNRDEQLQDSYTGEEMYRE